ncbi:UPF0161 protein At3g09310 [Ricinus communis]|uniref:UPF0161 protein At3g09310 n=1 Tax=Ricinus communis TaxID=3988 RepID=UPI00201A2D14|nr:UPF0161 protein At3g09310 [Ricinus communis]XP_015581970.2 UPF0161 protein At3g09310 [Ricinus communis]
MANDVVETNYTDCATHSTNQNPDMALVISLNNPGPLCFMAIVPKKSLNTTIESRRCSFRISIKSLRPKHRSRRLVVNKLDTSSNQNNQQDEEVNNLGVKAALSMLKFYKREISPLLPNSCRYVPTCSEYSMIAYKKYGVVKGTVLTAWRLCRCNPLGGSGFDPPRWFDEKIPPQE